MLSRLLCVIVLLSCARLEAQVVVSVRAQSELRLQEVDRKVHGDGRLSQVRVRATLRDTAGVALPGERVVLSLGTASEPLTTDEDGVVSTTLPPLPQGRHLVRARYGGDGLRTAAAAELPIDLSRRRVALSLSLPPRGALGGEVEVVVEARQDDGAPLGAGAGEIELRAGAAGRAAMGSVAGTAAERLPLTQRGSSHVASLRLSPPLRGGQQVRLVARFVGNSFYGEAQTEGTLLVVTQPRLSLSPPTEVVAQGRRLLLSGSARDEDGPVAGEVVEVSASPDDGGQVRLGSATVAADGGFTVELSRLTLPLGRALLTARLPQRLHRMPAEATLSIPVVAPPAVSLVYYGAPLALTVLCALLLQVWRRRHGLLARLGRHAETGPRRAGSAGRPAAGLMPALPRLRRATELVVTGTVVDAVSEAPLAARLVAAGGAIACDAAGGFTLPLSPGEQVIDVTMDGYLAERFVATLPHRGELTGVRVALRPLREVLLSLWQEATAPLAPTAVLTPRELLDLVRAREPEATARDSAAAGKGPGAVARDSGVAASDSAAVAREPGALSRDAGPAVRGPESLVGPLAGLTDLVESSCFAPRPCDGAALAEAQRLLAELAAVTRPT